MLNTSIITQIRRLLQKDGDNLFWQTYHLGAEASHVFTRNGNYSKETAQNLLFKEMPPLEYKYGQLVYDAEDDIYVKLTWENIQEWLDNGKIRNFLKEGDCIAITVDNEEQHFYVIGINTTNGQTEEEIDGKCSTIDFCGSSYRKALTNFRNSEHQTDPETDSVDPNRHLFGGHSNNGKQDVTKTVPGSNPPITTTTYYAGNYFLDSDIINGNEFSNKFFSSLGMQTVDDLSSTSGAVAKNKILYLDSRTGENWYFPILGDGNVSIYGDADLVLRDLADSYRQYLLLQQYMVEALDEDIESKIQTNTNYGSIDSLNLTYGNNLTQNFVNWLKNNFGNVSSFYTPMIITIADAYIYTRVFYKLFNTMSGWSNAALFILRVGTKQEDSDPLFDMAEKYYVDINTADTAVMFLRGSVGMNYITPDTQTETTPIVPRFDFTNNFQAAMTAYIEEIGVLIGSLSLDNESDKDHIKTQSLLSSGKESNRDMINYVSFAKALAHAAYDLGGTRYGLNSNKGKAIEYYGEQDSSDLLNNRHDLSRDIWALTETELFGDCTFGHPVYSTGQMYQYPWLQKMSNRKAITRDLTIHADATGSPIMGTLTPVEGSNTDIVSMNINTLTPFSGNLLSKNMDMPICFRMQGVEQEQFEQL